MKAKLGTHVALVLCVGMASCNKDPETPASPTVAISSSDGPRIVVAASSSLIRATPAIEGRVVMQATRNTEFSVVGSTEGWVKVALGSEGEGWIPDTEVGVKVKQRNGKFCLEMELENAWNVGAIRGAFSGNDASSGDSITLRASGTLTLSICPKFRRGTKLKNGNGGAQDMVLRAPIEKRGDSYFEVKLHFEPDVQAEYSFEAYCLDFEKENPSKNDRLTVNGTASSNVQRILDLTQFENSGAIQIAMWAITDDVSLLSLREKFEFDAEDLLEARAIIQAAGFSPSNYRIFR